MTKWCNTCDHKAYCRGGNDTYTMGCSRYIKAKPMTNEQYLRSCTTEQLAEWLHDITGYEGICSVCTDCTVSKHEKCRYNDGVDGWSLWLKQPHREE